MIRILKDSAKVNVLLAILFAIGTAASAYVLYRLPHELRIPAGYESTFQLTYIIVGIAFVVGAVALTQALRYKKELIVYRDRDAQATQADGTSADAQQGAISVENIKASLRTAKNEKEILHNGLQSICKQLEAGQGAAYAVGHENETRFAELKTGYALSMSENATVRFTFGEGLIGQAAANGQTLYLDEVPEGYIKIISGLGSASPRYLLIVPVKHQDTVLGVLEIASFTPLNSDQRKFAEQGAQLVAEKLSSK